LVAAGAKDVAIVKEFNVTADERGIIQIVFQSIVTNATNNAIEIVEGPGGVPLTPKTAAAVAANPPPAQSNTPGSTDPAELQSALSRKPGNKNRPTVRDGGKVEFAQMANVYQVNEVMANLRYTGRRITVTGEFEGVKMEKGEMGLQFAHAPDSYALTCYLAKSQQDAATNLKRGQRVSVEGISKGMTEAKRISMNDCKIVTK
jgi:hypothetical protein